jgi:hypothetical protein
VLAALLGRSSPVSRPASHAGAGERGPDLLVHFVNTHSWCAKTSENADGFYPEI